MLKKILKIVGIILAVIILLLAGFYAKVYFSTESKMNKKYEVTAQSLDITPDSAMLALGARLVIVKGCVECHGTDLGGKAFIDDAPLGLFIAKNLTKGVGGLPQDYDVNDWVRAIKHGVRRDGTSLLFMPSSEYTFLSEGDMKALIAYCMRLPNVDRELPPTAVGPLGRILADFDQLPLFPAANIDHTRMLQPDVKVEVSVEYGKYLSIACQGCHKPSMKGGEPVAPGYPPVADISSTGNAAKWSNEQFITTLRTGVTPEGKTLLPKNMPWTMTQAYTDVELKALHAYLKSL
ncbi:MAG: cytochrome c4 [Bacteroidota bacterium]